MAMKDLIGKRISKKIKFMGEELTMYKLTVDEVVALQAESKTLTEDSTDGIRVLRKIIQTAIEGATDISDEDFNKFPMQELSNLSGEIMKFSGMGDDAKGK
jgi:hypothetical protein